MVIAHAAELLYQRGEDGMGASELLTAVGRSDSDNEAGYLTRALREHGFLVQKQERSIFVLPEASIRRDYYVRHKAHGVVKIRYEREGFPKVKVVVLGDGKTAGTEIVVDRSELSGK